jgi:two-component system sensor histidine kinase AlgZ
VSRPAAEGFLPDFCATQTVFLLVLIAELIAIVVALAGSDGASPFLRELAFVSLFVQWLTLTSAAMLCALRRALAGAGVAAASAGVLTMLSVNAALVSLLAYALGSLLAVGDIRPGTLPDEPLVFTARNVAITVILSALLLRYFYVAHQWRRNVEREAESRIHALQARIRPHFLFNSMNTIAALTRSDPSRAEEAVEDLADLFRASLAEARERIPIKEELEVARIYQRIEQLRLGDRLRVEWKVDELPMRGLVPGLTVQPLIENAIYHGIEPLPGGGTVTVEGERVGDRIRIRVSNPLAPDGGQENRPGNRLALDNIRERLTLAFGPRASLSIQREPTRYRVELEFPYVE